MQHFSLLSLGGGPIQGLLDCHNIHTGYTGLMNQEALNQERHLHQPTPFPTFEENPPAMDELLEHFLSCSDLSGLNKEPLDQGLENSILDSENSPIVVNDQANHSLLDVQSMVGGFLEKIQQNLSVGQTNQVVLDPTGDGHYTDDNLLLVSQQNGFPSEDHTPGCSGGMDGDSPFSSFHLHPCSSMINSATALPMLLSSTIMSSSTPTLSAGPHSQMESGYTVPESLKMQPESALNQMHPLGKRFRDHQASMNELTSPPAGIEKVSDLTAAENMGRFQIVSNINQLNAQDITAAPQAIPNQPLHGHEAGGHHSLSRDPKTCTPAETLRPRARARRGQATDPHSIAERLRRERISDRMKSLQELVPNSNKTDKASMLDEIIEYVKFLQLQVKVLSMSRLGSAKAITPPIDLQLEGLDEIGLAKTLRGIHPSEDPASLTERQIAKLMEEDMGTAMQYLQTKGLCLMPIALANSMSSKTKSIEIGKDLTKATAITQQGIESGCNGDATEDSTIDAISAKKFFG